MTWIQVSTVDTVDPNDHKHNEAPQGGTRLQVFFLPLKKKKR